MQMEMKGAFTSRSTIRHIKFLRSRAMVVAFLVFSCTAVSFSQTAGETGKSSEVFSVHATHLLGLEGTRNNSTGTLSIKDGLLQFQSGSKPVVQLSIASVQDVFLGDESKQVGGLPMTLGKAAVPFGGGRVVSLFTHKKYDTVTLEYVGDDGGIHGAIFQLSQGQGKLFRDQLAATGAHVSQNGTIKQNKVEVSRESK